MSRLPEGWTKTSLKELLTFKYGKGLPQETRQPGEVRVYGSNGVVGEHNKSVTNGVTIIVGRKGSVGEVHINPDGCWPIDTTYYIDEFPCEMPPDYWALFLKSLRLGEQDKSSAIPGISRDDIYRIEVPVPPITEQRRIAAKLKPLLDGIDAYQQRFAKIPMILKRFRQAVLAAACAGRLTAKWQEEHADVEPASMLIKEKRFKLAIPNGELPLLPDTWEWVSLGNYAQCSRGRFSVRPRNDPAYFDGQYPFIQIGDLSDEGGWITSHRQTLNDKGLAVSKNFPKGTVVIAIVGATIGNTGILAYDMCFTDSMVGIETGDEISNRYVELFLRHRKEEIRQSSYAGGGQPNIKLEVLNPYPMALPPLEEQYEIVRHVETLFKLADQIEARYQRAKPMVDKLPQSILAKAFRGELVPTEAELARREGRDYEPASVLLERIRSERAELAQGRKEKAGSKMKPIKGKVSGVAISKS